MAGDSKEAVERMAREMVEEADALDDVTKAFGDASPARIAKANLLRAKAEALRTLLAQRDAADRAGFERGVREAANACRAVQRRAKEAADIESIGDARRLYRERAWSANTCREEVETLLLAPAAIDEGTQR